MGFPTGVCAATPIPTIASLCNTQATAPEDKAARLTFHLCEITSSNEIASSCVHFQVSYFLLRLSTSPFITASHQDMANAWSLPQILWACMHVLQCTTGGEGTSTRVQLAVESHHASHRGDEEHGSVNEASGFVAASRAIPALLVAMPRHSRHHRGNFRCGPVVR